MSGQKLPEKSAERRKSLVLTSVQNHISKELSSKIKKQIHTANLADMKKMISFEADTKFRQDQMLRMKKNESRVRKRQRNRKSHTVAPNKKQLRF